MTFRGFVTILTAIAAAAFCATVWVEALVVRHPWHVLWLMVGGVSFLLVLGLTIWLSDWAGRP